MNTATSRIIIVATCIVLAGCSPDFVGSVHGYSGSGTIRGERFIATPTIVPDGASPMGRRTSPDGSEEDMFSTYTNGILSATGEAAIIAALRDLCAFAPKRSLASCLRLGVRCR